MQMVAISRYYVATDHLALACHYATLFAIAIALFAIDNYDFSCVIMTQMNLP